MDFKSLVKISFLVILKDNRIFYLSYLFIFSSRYMLAYMWDEWKWSLDLSEPADFRYEIFIQGVNHYRYICF